MRFVVDECTGPRVAEWLRTQGHEVYSIYHEARGASDTEVLETANDIEAILITNDRDFSAMVFRQKLPHRGVIFLRLSDERPVTKIATMRHLLENYADNLKNNFVTVTENGVRFAKS